MRRLCLRPVSLRFRSQLSPLRKEHFDCSRLSRLLTAYTVRGSTFTPQAFSSYIHDTTDEIKGSRARSYKAFSSSLATYQYTPVVKQARRVAQRTSRTRCPRSSGVLASRRALPRREPKARGAPEHSAAMHVVDGAYAPVELAAKRSLISRLSRRPCSTTSSARISSKTLLACSYSTTPCSVGRTPCRERFSSNGTRASRSRSASRSLTLGCERYILRAASEIVPSYTAAQNATNDLSFTV